MKDVPNKASISAGDQLLAQDTLLYEPLSGADTKMYMAYPSCSIPRFIAPLDDKVARLFLIRLLSTDRGLLGGLLRLVAKVPVVSYFLVKTFAEQVPFSTGAEVSFVEKIKNCVHINGDVFPRRPGVLSVTKFCQRIAGPDTKILFLVTDELGALCIVKVMRSRIENERLQRESSAQKVVAKVGVETARVYFESEINGRYLYAEEVVQGVALEHREALRREGEIIHFISLLPSKGSVATGVIADLFEKQAVRDAQLECAIARLRARNIGLKLGLTHSDLGRVNILSNHGKVCIVDWGRTSERPFYLIDAVYFLVRLYRIQSLEEWKSVGAVKLIAHTGISSDAGEALYDVFIMTEVLFKKHPAAYQVVVKEMFGWISQPE